MGIKILAAGTLCLGLTTLGLGIPVILTGLLLIIGSIGVLAGF